MLRACYLSSVSISSELGSFRRTKGDDTTACERLDRRDIAIGVCPSHWQGENSDVQKMLITPYVGGLIVEMLQLVFSDLTGTKKMLAIPYAGDFIVEIL
jgi:hypothetical protein